MPSIITKQIITDIIPIDLDPQGSRSIGELVDAEIERAHREGRVLVELAVHIDENEWAASAATPVSAGRRGVQSAPNSKPVKAASHA